jgi:uncharacterized membrane-anchored protein YhcB (DUF1043 family)
MKLRTTAAALAGISIGFSGMRLMSPSAVGSREEPSVREGNVAAEVVLVGAPFEELTVPEIPPRLPAGREVHPLDTENQRLRAMLKEIRDNRTSIEDRYRVIEDARHDLLGEHRAALSDDSEMLRVVRGEAAEIEARLLLRPEILRARQEALTKRHTELVERRENLTHDYEKALKEHARLTERLAQEKTKIETLISGRPKREQALAEAFERERRAYRRHERGCWDCNHSVQ